MARRRLPAGQLTAKMTASDEIGPCSPFLIVADVARSLDHYTGRLGFTCVARAPDEDPFFAIVARGSAQIMVKCVGPEVKPLPNRTRHPWARWDVFVFAPDPDALAREFASRAVVFRKPLANTDDGLRGFEVTDPDGYVSYFGRPGDSNGS